LERPQPSVTRHGPAILAAALVLALLLSTGPASARQGLPDRLSDEAFWHLITTLSEPDGEFRSDNLVSNERAYQDVMPRLSELAPGGAYLGVAPDQNFSYVLALQPRVAFVLDVRRGNLLEHLMFKALIEQSDTRAAFLSSLFARALPTGLDPDAPVTELFAALGAATLDDALRDATLAGIASHLVEGHSLPLTTADRQGITRLYFAFTGFGPDITYASTAGQGPRSMPSYADLQQMTDLEGRAWGYLASESAFAALRDFQRRNLLVPVIGDFSGPSALRGIGAWLTGRGLRVSAFYASNVEQYLFREGRWRAFYANVDTLPLAPDAVLIRSASGIVKLTD
jgi:hypothetical protein